MQTFDLGDMQRRSRLVEDENARILQQRPGDLDQLPVSKRQPVKWHLEIDVDAEIRQHTVRFATEGAARLPRPATGRQQEVFLNAQCWK